MEHSGFYLKEIRKILSLTQQEFGKKLGISKNSVSNIERGDSELSKNVINKLTVDLNVNPKYLFTGEGEPFVLDETQRDNNIKTVKLKRGQLLRVEYED